ncbi:hypothetical protein CHU98_g11715 [Xylaria longipes]|nr:hypothetical protein CHU98_g11715 [Xylaria longipes]
MSLFLDEGPEDGPSGPVGSEEPSAPLSSRGELLSSKTTMQDRKKRPRPHDANGEIAEDDERERKLSRVSRWQIFLYHRHLPTKEVETIKSAYGDVEPTSYAYTAARQRLVDDQKNFKNHVLANMAGLALEIAKWLRAKESSTAEGAHRRQEVHNFYFAMPKKANFSGVSKTCFHEVFEHQRNQKRSRVDNAAAEEAAHGRFEIDEAPPPPPE